ncbi:hypothetical protein BH10PSE4_BH10PSE4_27820 [soil metagenome]
MQALPQRSPSTPWRAAEIVSVETLNRARSMRTLAADPGAPAEAHPWAYVFPRPQPLDQAYQVTRRQP